MKTVTSLECVALFPFQIHPEPGSGFTRFVRTERLSRKSSDSFWSEFRRVPELLNPQSRSYTSQGWDEHQALAQLLDPHQNLTDENIPLPVQEMVHF